MGGDRIVGIVVYENGLLRNECIAAQQKLENTRVGLDHSFFSRDDGAVEPGEERKASSLRREGLGRPVAEGVKRRAAAPKFSPNGNALLPGPRGHFFEARPPRAGQRS